MPASQERKKVYITKTDDIVIIPLHDILDCIKEVHPDTNLDSLRIISSRMVEGNKNHRFEYHIVRDLHSILYSEDGRKNENIILAKSLLMNSFESQDHDNIKEIFLSMQSVQQIYAS